MAHLKGCFNYFIKNKCEFLLSSSKFYNTLPWWSFTVNEENEPKYNFPDQLTKRSQDLEEIYCITGALWIAKAESLKNEKTFCLTYGDGVSDINIKKSIDFHKSHKKMATISAVIPPARFGALNIQDGVVKDFIEKPSPEKAPSNLINNGYAIITPEIWELLSTAKSTVSDGEVRLADSFIKYVSLGHPLYALEAEKPGYDCGNKLGFLEANIDFALTREDLKEDLKNILKKKINN